MKKFLAVLLASMLLVAMFAIPASAEEINVLLGKNVILGDNTQVSAYTGGIAVITDGLTNADGWSAAAIDRIDKSEGVDACAYVTFDAFAEASITRAELTITRGEALGVPYEPKIEAKIDGAWVFLAWLTGEEAATGSYVMSATFDAVTTTEVRLSWYAYGWAPIDEFAVYGTPTAPVVDTTPETSTPSTDTPSNTVSVNLVEGSAVAFENITANGGEGRSDVAVITDGVVPGTPVDVWGAGLWYGLKGTDSAVKSTITFDAFDGSHSITDASVALGVDHPSGIGVPGTMTLEGLANGEWVEIGTFAITGVPQWSAESTYVDLCVAEYTATSDVAVSQVRLSFYSYGWNWLGEVEVNAEVEAPEGTTSTPSTSTPSTGTPNTGDASSVVMFAVIALVAIAGSAVVIRKRG